jgi:hypothetical protein
MYISVSKLFRKASWFVIFIGLLMLSATEFGIPPPKYPYQPKPPIWHSRLLYIAVFALGTPGVVWALVRTWRGDQRSPWE